MKRLILFDVDGTLIKRGDPDHLGAIDHGVHTLFPQSAAFTVRQLDFDGKVDRLIASEVLALAGIGMLPEDPALNGVFDYAGSFYREQWARKSNGKSDLLPGVSELVEQLSGDNSFALGVMTGGSREITAVKLDRLGLSGWFPVGSFGDEVPNRPALVPLALERAREHYTEPFPPEQVVIIGDTPADVHCAHVHGIACLAVATGKYTADDLRTADADQVTPTLEDGASISELLNRMIDRG